MVSLLGPGGARAYGKDSAMPHASVERVGAPGADGLFVEVGFENSNPQRAEFVAADEEGTLVVRQFLEDGAPEGYSFHLNVAFVNESRLARPVPLRIEWGEKNFDFCHDYMYVGYDSGAEWRMLSTPCKDGVTEMELIVPPGRHVLCCSPKFDCADCDAMLRRSEKLPSFERIEVTETPQGQTISCLRCGTPGAPKAVVVTRAHGYETAGAHCIDGWLMDVAAAPDKHASTLSSLEIYLFPIINPDAVAAGRCCLAPGGVNFGRELVIRADEDSGAKGLCDFVFDLKPDFILDMHNNTGPHLRDSFRCPSQEFLDRFAAVAPDRSRDQKTWGLLNREYVDGYLAGACAARFGALMVLTEFPWYTRLPSDMREHGASFLSALFSLFAGS